jgi:hypothetical protein
MFWGALVESMTDQLSRLLVLQIVGNTTVADGNVKSAIVRHGLIDQSKRLVSFGKVGADADRPNAVFLPQPAGDRLSTILTRIVVDDDVVAMPGEVIDDSGTNAAA